MCEKVYEDGEEREFCLENTCMCGENAALSLSTPAVNERTFDWKSTTICIGISCGTLSFIILAIYFLVLKDDWEAKQTYS